MARSWQIKKEGRKEARRSAPKQVLRQVQVSEPALVGGSLLTPEKGHL
ncbi:hypothetical protein GCM10007855_42080 [Aliivibrio sifiae]|uniref:Uncharacterized protein n=1 Tax=Aliivibrio sifiae TaxID=566293 RepID=A0ABQ6ALY6_9GAMM|nr:hypothetical protein GCM10007855_42080 [Aliivibrio sifiae]